MIKTCCGECGECWYIGNPRTCKCPDETPKKPWIGLTAEERNYARQSVTYSQLAMTAGEWAEAVQIETEQRLKEKNHG
jgi:hypothetical protein